MEEGKTIDILCEDGFSLAGTLYLPEGTAKAAVMMAPATAIKQHFYSAFANYLASSGFVVVTYDNRGIGASKGEHINSSNPSLINWGRLDMTAVLEYLKANFPSLDYHLIGHSAGGQLVGLMKNAKELTSLFNVASSSGSLKNFDTAFKVKSNFLMNVYIPVNNLLFGHTKTHLVGMGEPLPKEVGAQWRRWCNGAGYVAVDLETKIKDHIYNELDFPSLWVFAEDDDIANLANVKDMIRVFPNIQAKIVQLNPSDYGFSEIGHMKFFSSKKRKLWTLVSDWLEENTQ